MDWRGKKRDKSVEGEDLPEEDHPELAAIVEPEGFTEVVLPADVPEEITVDCCGSLMPKSETLYMDVMSKREEKRWYQCKGKPACYNALQLKIQEVHGESVIEAIMPLLQEVSADPQSPPG